MNTINPEEITKFNQMADEWWSANGKFKPLHQFNPCRIAYIKEKIINNFGINPELPKPLKGLKILDVGCGGGLICEPLARLGAEIVGIDAGEKNIAIAKIHSKQSGLEIDYRCQDVEELSKSEEKFDVVLALEVIEHVADIEKFLIASANCLKKNLSNKLNQGQESNLQSNFEAKNKSNLMFVATINRTAKSYLKAIIGAEYILRWLPKGTHNWQKFLKPSEINQIAEKNNLQLLDMAGFSYNLLKNEWKESKDLDTNYAMVFCNKI